MKNAAPLEVAAAVIVHEARALVTRRLAGAAHGGLWEFPGGKREPDETFAACLRRELREELGIEVAGLRRWTTVEHTYESGPVRIVFYRCSVSPAEARRAHPHGAEEVRWAAAADLRALSFPEADAAILERLARVLERAARGPARALSARRP